MTMNDPNETAVLKAALDQISSLYKDTMFPFLEEMNDDMRKKGIEEGTREGILIRIYEKLMVTANG